MDQSKQRKLVGSKVEGLGTQNLNSLKCSSILTRSYLGLGKIRRLRPEGWIEHSWHLNFALYATICNCEGKFHSSFD